jgi:hypothetical protein
VGLLGLPALLAVESAQWVARSVLPVFEAGPKAGSLGLPVLPAAESVYWGMKALPLVELALRVVKTAYWAVGRVLPWHLFQRVPGHRAVTAGCPI